MLCLGSSNITLKSHDLESWLITFITLWLSMLHIFLPNLTLLSFTENEKNQQKGIWRKHGKPFLPFLLLINRLPVFNCTTTPPFYHISISPGHCHSLSKKDIICKIVSKTLSNGSRAFKKGGSYLVLISATTSISSLTMAALTSEKARKTYHRCNCGLFYQPEGWLHYKLITTS